MLVISKSKTKQQQASNTLKISGVCIISSRDEKQHCDELGYNILK